MPPRLLPQSPAKLHRDVEHLFDVVARLLAKRWLREQQSETPADAQQGQKGVANSQTLKA